jgi:hypothetical protein
MMTTWDAVVIGGGHNGADGQPGVLAAPAFERRDTSAAPGCHGGDRPGFRASTGAYIASMMRPEVIRALGLTRYGLRMTPRSAQFIPARNGNALYWQDPRRTAAGIGFHRATRAPSSPSTRRSSGSRPTSSPLSAAAGSTGRRALPICCGCCRGAEDQRDAPAARSDSDRERHGPAAPSSVRGLSPARTSPAPYAGR